MLHLVLTLSWMRSHLSALQLVGRLDCIPGPSYCHCCWPARYHYWQASIAEHSFGEAFLSQTAVAPSSTVDHVPRGQPLLVLVETQGTSRSDCLRDIESMLVLSHRTWHGGCDRVHARMTRLLARVGGGEANVWNRSGEARNWEVRAYN